MTMFGYSSTYVLYTYVKKLHTMLMLFPPGKASFGTSFLDIWTREMGEFSSPTCWESMVAPPTLAMANMENVVRNQWISGVAYVHVGLFWVNYNISLPWIKAIWGWFPLLTMIPVRSQWGRYNLPRLLLFLLSHDVICQSLSRSLLA